MNRLHENFNDKTGLHPQAANEDTFDLVAENAQTNKIEKIADQAKQILQLLSGNIDETGGFSIPSFVQTILQHDKMDKRKKEEQTKLHQALALLDKWLDKMEQLNTQILQYQNELIELSRDENCVVTALNNLNKKGELPELDENGNCKDARLEKLIRAYEERTGKTINRTSRAEMGDILVDIAMDIDIDQAATNRALNEAMDKKQKLAKEGLDIKKEFNDDHQMDAEEVLRKLKIMHQNEQSITNNDIKPQGLDAEVAEFQRAFEHYKQYSNKSDMEKLAKVEQLLYSVSNEAKETIQSIPEIQQYLDAKQEIISVEVSNDAQHSAPSNVVTRNQLSLL